MSRVKLDPAALDRAARRLAGAVEGEDQGSAPECEVGSTRVRAAADRVQELLDAGAAALVTGTSDARSRVRSAADRWRAQDAALVGSGSGR